MFWVKNMPEEVLNIILIVIAALVALYVLTLVVVLTFVLTFRKINKDHSKSLAILLTIKFENIKNLLELIDLEKTDIDAKLVNEFNQIKTKWFLLPPSEECKRARDVLSNLRDQIFLVAAKNPTLEKHSKFNLGKENIQEADKVYRIKLAMYNADVLGYNYWIKFLPTRFIFTIFGCKEKELI